MRAAFHTLGCKTNAYETQAIQEQFRSAGYEIGAFDSSCDIYVINTCAVTAEAARKSRQMAGRCKRNNPLALVVVTGCYAQEAADMLLGDGMADLVVGNNEKSRILSMVSERMSGRKEPGEISGGPFETKDSVPRRLVADLSRCTEYESQHITGQEGHVRAYVKIQDGCNRFCSYCLIPYLRGRSRSRRIEEILQEAEGLADSGYRELVLTGIDISSFQISGGMNEDSNLSMTGSSRAAQQQDTQTALAALIRQLAQIPGIQRIRLGSLEAGIVKESLLQQLKETPEFCPQFHLSLQSGSDSVLRRMNRQYSAEEFAEAARIIRTCYPEAAITTDIITGFPGETDEEYEETLQFVDQIAFSRLHVFPFSRRKGTRADQLPDQLSRAVREERARRLIRRGEEMRQRYEEQWIGRSCEILAEEVLQQEDGWHVAGYTREYVHILARTAAGTYQEAKELVNQFLPVIPTEFRDGQLIAGEMPLESRADSRQSGLKAEEK